MRRAIRFALLAAAGIFAAASAAAQDPAPPVFRLPKSAEPLSYKVELEIDPAKTSFAGRVELEIRLKEASRILWLNAREIEIEEVSGRFGGKPVDLRTVAGGVEFVGFAFDRELPPGTLSLRLGYRGRIRENTTQGVFRQREGESWYVYTQFQTTDARRAVPCFDEPAFKVPWQVTLRVPKGTTAVSNMPAIETSEEAGGTRIVRFAKTPPMPSYLIAFGVGPFDDVEAGRAGRKSVPIRIIVPRGKADRTRLAVESTAPLLEALERYFGIPFPYAKLDQLVIPQTVTFGAMENAGLVTWGERYLLEAPGRESGEMRRLAIFINAHEIAHQWFGDLVTPAWWDDIWLNESFADWAAHKAVRAWKPESRGDASDLDDLFRALSADSVLAARQLHQPVLSRDDIDNAFDPISYEKGAAVIAMFESWIGEEKFRSGVRRYLREHANGVATSRDFLAAIEASGAAGAAAAFTTFLDQPGVPLVDAALACDAPDRPRLRLSQSRFLPIGSERPSPQFWHIPVCASDSRGKPGDATCTLLKEASGTLELPRGPCPSWALLRAGGSGYYRVRYEAPLAERLAEALDLLPVDDRGFLVRDTAGLARAGAVTVARGLELSERSAKDPSWFVVDASIRLPSSVAQDALDAGSRDAFARWVRQVWGDRARAIGFTGGAGEGENARRIRRSVVPFVARVGEDAPLRAEASRLAEAWLENRGAVEPDMVGRVLETAALEGNRALFGRFLAEARRAPERRDRIRLLAALGNFRDPALRGEAFQIFLSDAFPPLEAAAILQGAAYAESPEVREGAWEFFKANYEAVVAKTPSEARGGLPSYASFFCDEAHRKDVEAFFEDRVASLSGGPRNLAATLERIAQCDAFRKLAEPEIEAFLRSSGGGQTGVPP